MYYILANPYYMGVVRYRGIHYEGKHTALVEPDTWLQVQDTLAAHNHTGEKDRKHPHYLRGTIFCSSCGARLVYFQNTGNGGTYTYYMCLKRKIKANNCHRPAMRLERIENGIADFYDSFIVQPHYAQQIQDAVRQELANQQTEASRDLGRAVKRKQHVESERRTLLHAHYAGAIPQDLLASEMQRFTRQLAEADTAISAAKATASHVEATLRDALHAASNCQRAYLNTTGSIRRQINQGFFAKLFIGEDGTVERVELTEPFATLLAEGQVLTRPATDSTLSLQPIPAEPRTPEQHQAGGVLPSSVLRTLDSLTESEHKTTHRPLIRMVRGLNEGYVVGRLGLEPRTYGLKVRSSTN